MRCTAVWLIQTMNGKNILVFDGDTTAYEWPDRGPAPWEGASATPPVSLNCECSYCFAILWRSLVMALR